MSAEVFLDTAALLALVNRSDALNQRATHVLAALNSAGRSIVTTQWVLSEFLSGAARPPLRTAAIRVVDRLCRSERTTIVAASGELWLRGFVFYRERSDKSWSHVDCTSMAICQERGIADVFTSDRHFAQAGFSILMPPE